jgi:ADP-ribose pyrophosphatase
LSFETIGSEKVYDGRALHIRRDHVRLPDGRTTDWEVVEHPGSVVILPVDQDGNLLFVRQYRHAAGLDLLELPAGTRDGQDEPPITCAGREVREETGMAAGCIEEIGKFYLAPGYSTEYMYVFLATDLRHDPLDPDADEFLKVERIPVQQALEMAARGDLPDAKSLAALFLAAPRLESLIS